MSASRRRTVECIRLDPSPPGLTALLIVQAADTKSGEAARHLLSQTLGPEQIRWVCRGRVLAAAVRLQGNEQILAELEEALRAEHPFFARLDSFCDLTYRIVEDMAQQTNSHLLRLPRCAICRRPDPFPTQVELIADAGICLRRRSYCLTCVAETAAGTRQPHAPSRRRVPLVADLLMADPRGLRFRGVRLVKLRSRGQAGVFRVERTRPEARVA